MNSIISACNSASSFFYSIYLEVLGWVWPFWLAATYFYNLSVLFGNLAWYFYDFNTWVDATAKKLLDILSWDTIKSYIRNWLPNLESVVSWFSNWWNNVTSVITSWWATTSVTVQSWIDAAKSFLQSQINFVNQVLTNLSASWDSFKGKIPSIDLIISWFTDWWGKTLAQIINWGALTATQIQDLINTAFKDWEPFLEGWQDWRDAIVEFFTDPEEWLYKAVDRIIERFW